MRLSQDFKTVLLFLNRILAAYLAYMALRAIWTAASLLVVTVLLLAGPGVSLSRILAGFTTLALLTLSFRRVLRRREIDMMVRFRDSLIGEEPEPESGSLPPEEGTAGGRFRGDGFLAELAGQAPEPHRVRRWKRVQWELRFRRWLLALCILIPFLGMAILLPFGMHPHIRVFALLAAVFLGGGFSGGLLTPVYSLLLVLRLRRHGE